MSIYNEDSIGRRIAWARKQKGMTGHQLARALVTPGTMTGVRNVYVSQLENNHASPSLPLLRKIAEVLGVTVGFLLMETDYPYPAGKAEPEPVYFSPEADAAAQIIDAAPPEERERILTVVRAIAGAFSQGDKDAANERVIYLPNFAQRLIYGENVEKRRREQSL